MISLKKRKFCCTCGSQMVRFRYPGRWRCPRERVHGLIFAEQRQGAPRGRRSPEKAAIAALNLAKARAAKR